MGPLGAIRQAGEMDHGWLHACIEVPLPAHKTPQLCRLPDPSHTRRQVGSQLLMEVGRQGMAEGESTSLQTLGGRAKRDTKATGYLGQRRFLNIAFNQQETCFCW